MLAGTPEATLVGWDATAISNGHSNGHTRTAGHHQNGSRAAMATAEVTEQQQLLRQLQHGLHELQTRLLQDQQHLGSATSALQVSDLALTQQLETSSVQHAVLCMRRITMMAEGSNHKSSQLLR